MEILKDEIENEGQLGSKAPRIMLIFLTSLFFIALIIFKRLSFYFSIKDLPKEERFHILDWFWPAGDLNEHIIVGIFLFVGCITSIVFLVKQKEKLKSKREWVILLNPFVIMVIYKLISYLTNELLYSLI